MANKKPTQENTPSCSFCGKPLTPMSKAVSGMYATICEDCVKLASGMMAAKSPMPKETKPKKASALPSPEPPLTDR